MYALLNKHKNNKNIKYSYGFTIIEIIVVIVVIGLLTGISVVSFGNWKKSATEAQVKSDLNGVASAMEDARNFGEDGYPAAVPTTIKASDGVTIEGGSTDNGKSYCVQAYNAEQDVYFYVSSTSGGKPTVQEGTCGPANLVATVECSTQIDLSWDGLAGANSYTVERATNSNFTQGLTTVATVASPTTIASATGLTASTKYYFRVKAITDGVSSAWSVDSVATTSETVDPPTSNPVVTVDTSGVNAVASVAALDCSTNTAEYRFKSRINDGSYTSFGSWSTSTSASQAATEGYKYGYKAEARCNASGSYSSSVASTEGSAVKYYAAGGPSAPVVTATTNGSTTTWSWPAVTCSGGTVRYQYRYTIPTSGYDSGWITYNQIRSVSFTTSTETQTYVVEVQAQCYTAYDTSDWSTSGTASYHRSMTWTKLSAGEYGGCGLASVDGKLYCWGSDVWGQLGDGATQNVCYPAYPTRYCSAVPVKVNDTGALSGKTITDFFTTHGHACALDSTGKVYCWGENEAGQLGDNTIINKDAPVAVYTAGALSGKTIQAITGKEDNSCALDTAGKAYCWGKNDYGQIGDNTGGSGTYKQVPTAVYTSGVLSGKVISSLVSGGNHTCALVTVTNLMYCWGWNTSGQIGDNTSGTDRYAPTAVNMASGVSSMYGKTVKAITAGGRNTCAIASDDTAHCWGRNSYGTVGNNTTATRQLVPAAVYTAGALSGKTISKISHGGDVGCVIASDNKPYCWGGNLTGMTFGMMGDGTTNQYLAPNPMDTTGNLNGKTITSITVGSDLNCLLTSDGVGHCMGSNAYGEPADNSIGSNVLYPNNVW